MNKLHITIVAGLLAAAAVLGTVAATHTVSLGAGQSHTSTNTVLARTRQLGRFEASLRKALAKKPPALPALPSTPAAQPRVIYQRPPAIVVVRHTHHGDDGSYEASDGEGGGGGD